MMKNLKENTLYEAMILEDGFGPNKKGTGNNWILTFHLNTDHGSAKVKKWFCVTHENEVAMQISYVAIQDLCNILNINFDELTFPLPKDKKSLFLGKWIKVTVRPFGDKEDPIYTIKKFYPKDFEFKKSSKNTVTASELAQSFPEYENKLDWDDTLPGEELPF